MPKIDIVRLRKERGLSQLKLARQLEIAQSHLSGVENGKSQLSPDKEQKLKKIFNLDSFDGYYIDDNIPTIQSCQSPEIEWLGNVSDSDLLNQLLTRFHRHAHNEIIDEEHHHHSHHERIEVLEKSNARLLDYNNQLLDRNERLESRLETALETIETLRNENDRLRKDILDLHHKSMNHV